MKVATDIDKSTLASKTNLDVLKTEIDSLKVGSLKIVPTDLSRIRNVVDNDVAKKSV